MLVVSSKCFLAPYVFDLVNSFKALFLAIFFLPLTDGLVVLPGYSSIRPLVKFVSRPTLNGPFASKLLLVLTYPVRALLDPCLYPNGV